MMMRVVGFTFIRNGIKFDYPFRESILSLLPLCDEIIVVAGDSEDTTTEELRMLQSPKVKIIETRWDPTLRKGGKILAQQTNIALSHVKGDWGIYLQADEVLHENDYDTIREALEHYRTNTSVEGLLFSYYHFFGSYRYIGDSRRWYRREIRIVKPHRGLESWGDAQGFRTNGRKLRVKLINAHVYHYGWVKPPVIQQAKQRTFNALWHPEEWIQKHIGNSEAYDYASHAGKLKIFDGTHPAVMQERIAAVKWNFECDTKKVKESIKARILDFVERKTGYRIGEYKNYVLLDD